MYKYKGSVEKQVAHFGVKVRSYLVLYVYRGKYVPHFLKSSAPISINFVMNYYLYDKDIDSCTNFKRGWTPRGSTRGQKHVKIHIFKISSETSVPILTTQYASFLGLGLSELLKLGAGHVEIGDTN